MREPSKWVATAPARTSQMGRSSPRGEPWAPAAQNELQYSGGHAVFTMEGAFLHPGGWVGSSRFIGSP